MENNLEGITFTRRCDDCGFSLENEPYSMINSRMFCGNCVENHRFVNKPKKAEPIQEEPIICTDCNKTITYPYAIYRIPVTCDVCFNKRTHKRRISEAVDISHNREECSKVDMFYSEEFDDYASDPDDYMMDRFDGLYDPYEDDNAFDSYDDNPRRFVWWVCVPCGPKKTSAIDHLQNLLESIWEEYPEETAGDEMDIPKDDENIICDLLQKWLDTLPELYYPEHKKYVVCEISADKD